MIGRIRQARRARGYSFVEILVVITIMGLMLAIAVPAFQTVMHRSRIEGFAREIGLRILAARLQAIKRGGNVGVVLSNDPSSSIGAYDTAISFVDANTNGALDTGGTPDPVLNTDPLNSPGHHVTVSIDDPGKTTPSSTPATAYFIFTPFGSIGSGGDKAIYISDSASNVLEIAVTTPGSGKVAITKLVPGATPLYQPPPWHWN